MDKNRWMSGLILVIIGLVFLLANLGIISWSFMLNLVTLWPLVLIVIGVNIVFNKNYIIRTGAWIILIIALIGYSIVNDNYRHLNYSYNSSLSQGSALEMDEEIVSGELELKLGGTELSVFAGNNDYLFNVISNDKVHHRLERKNNNRKAIVHVENTSKEFLGRNRINHKIDLSLNPDIPWEVNAKVGAIAGRLDFSDVELNQLKIEVGAGDLEIRFGTLSSNTSAEINAGATNLKIHIPSSLGVKINSSSVLSNTNLSSLGWTKLGSEYISPNYEDAENKLYIDVKMGIGNMNVYYAK